LKDEIVTKILLKKLVKVTKRMRIKFDEKNKNKKISNKININ